MNFCLITTIDLIIKPDIRIMDIKGIMANTTEVPNVGVVFSFNVGVYFLNRTYV